LTNHTNLLHGQLIGARYNLQSTLFDYWIDNWFHMNLGVRLTKPNSLFIRFGEMPARLYTIPSCMLAKYCSPLTHRVENIVLMPMLGGRRCLVDKVLTMDYNCRYSLAKRPSCYCCGEILSYIELGRLCRKFCKKNGVSRKGQEAVIVLPFSWGEGEDRVKLEGV
jgi:hypothetical protein